MLRIAIDGRWTAKDFENYFGALHTLYSTFAIISFEMEGEESGWVSPRLLKERAPPYRRYYVPSGYPFLDAAFVPPALFRDADPLLQPRERLRVRRCDYASPGVTDLTGLGEVLVQLKEIIFRFVDRKDAKRQRDLQNDLLEQEVEAKAIQNETERRRRELENDILEQELHEKRLQNLHHGIEVLKSVGYTEVHCRKIIAEVGPAFAKIEGLVERGLITSAENIDDAE